MDDVQSSENEGSPEGYDGVTIKIEFESIPAGNAAESPANSAEEPLPATNDPATRTPAAEGEAPLDPTTTSGVALSISPVDSSSEESSNLVPNASARSGTVGESSAGSNGVTVEVNHENVSAASEPAEKESNENADSQLHFDEALEEGSITESTPNSVLVEEPYRASNSAKNTNFNETYPGDENAPSSSEEQSNGSASVQTEKSESGESSILDSSPSDTAESTPGSDTAPAQPFEEPPQEENQNANDVPAKDSSSTDGIGTPANNVSPESGTDTSSFVENNSVETTPSSKSISGDDPASDAPVQTSVDEISQEDDGASPSNYDPSDGEEAPEPGQGDSENASGITKSSPVEEDSHDNNADHSSSVETVTPASEKTGNIDDPSLDDPSDEDPAEEETGDGTSLGTGLADITPTDESGAGAGWNEQASTKSLRGGQGHDGPVILRNFLILAFVSAFLILAVFACQRRSCSQRKNNADRKKRKGNAPQGGGKEEKTVRWRTDEAKVDDDSAIASTDDERSLDTIEGAMNMSDSSYESSSDDADDGNGEDNLDEEVSIGSNWLSMRLPSGVRAISWDFGQIENDTDKWSRGRQEAPCM